MKRERSIILHANEIRTLQQRGEVTIRRDVKPQPEPGTDCPYHIGVGKDRKARHLPFPVGARLAVRETWCQKCDDGRLVYNAEGNCDPSCYWYKADGETVLKDDGDGGTAMNQDGAEASPWCSAARMPRDAVRFRPTVASVRVVQGDKWQWEVTLKLDGGPR